MMFCYFSHSSLRINFAEDNKLDLSSSETLKLVQELDNTCQPSMEQGWSSNLSGHEFIIFSN